MTWLLWLAIGLKLSSLVTLALLAHFLRTGRVPWSR